VVATLGPGEKRVVFILGKTKFITEEWLEKFEINEGNSAKIATNESARITAASIPRRCGFRAGSGDVTIVTDSP